MALVVSLWSNREGEIKRFLSSFYGKNADIDSSAGQWIYSYNKPMDAIDIISAAVDNNDKYSISVCVQVDRYDLHHVNEDNHNDIIKGILYQYYEEKEEATY